MKTNTKTTVTFAYEDVVRILKREIVNYGLDPEAADLGIKIRPRGDESGSMVISIPCEIECKSPPKR